MLFVLQHYNVITVELFADGTNHRHLGDRELRFPGTSSPTV